MTFGQAAVNDVGQLVAEVIHDGEVIGHVVMALVPTAKERGIGLAIERESDDDHGWADRPPEGR